LLTKSRWDRRENAGGFSRSVQKKAERLKYDLDAGTLRRNFRRRLCGEAQPTPVRVANKLTAN
jgi:hypothetical protein